MNTAQIAVQLHKNYEACIKKGIQPITERLIKGIKAPKETVLRVISKEFRDVEVDCEPEYMEHSLPLKDLVQNKKQLRSAMKAPRMALNQSQSRAVAFRIEGDTLKVIGFR